MRSLSISTASSNSLTVTPTQSGHSTPTAAGFSTFTAGPSNQSILPPSSPTFWEEISRLSTDDEQGETSDSSESESSELSQNTSMMVETCPGTLIHWQPGSVWNTYPYQRHDVQTLPWVPIGFDSDQRLQLRSVKCRLTLQSSKELQESTCSQCWAIESSSAFKKFVNSAVDPAKHTPWAYLNHRHIYELLAKATTENRLLKLKVCNILML